MARVTVEDCVDKVESPYELVLVAKERATQLNSGMEPTLDRDNDKNTVVSLREIAEETIPIETMKENLIKEYQTISPIDEENTESIDEENTESNITDQHFEISDNKEKDEIKELTPDENSEELNKIVEADQNTEENIASKSHTNQE